MRNEHLKQLFDELPRHGASDGFTDSVIRRLDGAERAHREPRMRRALLGAAATLLIAAGAAHLTLVQREQARIEALDTQRRQLQAEVAEISDQAEYEAVIDIGQEDGVRYILDLRPIELDEVQTVAMQPTFY